MRQSVLSIQWEYKTKVGENHFKGKNTKTSGALQHIYKKIQDKTVSSMALFLLVEILAKRH